MKCFCVSRIALYKSILNQLRRNKGLGSTSRPKLDNRESNFSIRPRVVGNFVVPIQISWPPQQIEFNSELKREPSHGRGARCCTTIFWFLPSPILTSLRECYNCNYTLFRLVPQPRYFSCLPGENPRLTRAN
ncbi:hypothetical protein J6590_001118 [Homalodisca vitripennis]|nr:hypothetical protein J6590_001118 [Homalodisca vitripennis]